jgi:diaminopropionate ammonia-lyase
MGRLDCKVASLVALDVLNDCADEFMLISDDDATDAVTVAGKFGVETTPSGAAGLAGLIVAARHSPESYKDSRPLVIISEGVAPNPDPD